MEPPPPPPTLFGVLRATGAQPGIRIASFLQVCTTEKRCVRVALALLPHTQLLNVFTVTRGAEAARYMCAHATRYGPPPLIAAHYDVIHVAPRPPVQRIFPTAAC